MEVPRASKVVVGICKKEKNEKVVEETKTKEITSETAQDCYGAPSDKKPQRGRN